ncbi:MAG: alpha/beta hydrolase, partial [Pseudomonadota bacterium]
MTSVSHASQPLASPASHIFFSQRLRLHYIDWGNNAAPPMVLVHGMQDHCR